MLVINKPAGLVVHPAPGNRQGTLVSALLHRAPDIFAEIAEDENENENRPGIVHRLDKDTTGLLLLTDDGALAHRLLSPRRHVDKIYLVRCREEIPPETAGRFLEGLDIGDEKKTLPALLEDIQGNTCRVTLREGRYHQVKRMFAAVGNEVTGLHRLAMGGLFLDEDLKPGTARRLTPEELAQLRQAAGPRDDADGPEEAAEFETEESTEADVEE